MQNNFSKLGKDVPRRTHSPWRWLTALLMILTLGIGQMLAADEVVVIGSQSSGNLTIATNTHSVAGYSGGTNTSTIANASDGQGASSGGSKMGSTSNKGSALASKNHVRFTVAAGETVRFYYYQTSGTNKSSTFATSDYSQSAAYYHAATAYVAAAKNTLYFIDFVFADAGTYAISLTTGQSVYMAALKFTAGSGGGDDPVCPSGLTISGTKDYTEGEKITLNAALEAGNGTITYQWYKGSVASGNEISGANKAKLEIASCVEGDAGSYYCVASKEDCSDAVSSAFAITVAHNPCATHHWFVATADATANGKTNWDGFTNAVTGSSGQTNSVTIDGTTYNLTKRTGSTGGGGTILGFTIPANKAGTLYGYMKSSGSAARTLSLKKGDDVVKTNTEIVDGNWTLITIDAIAPGTYTLSPDQNVQVQMFVLKVCDATFHTITLDLNGGTGETSISALDGAPATKPADPTKEHFRFDGWFDVTGPYDWSAPVTGDLTLTAHWTQLYTVSFQAGEGSGDAPAAVADKAEGETFEVPANTFTAPASKEFDIWNDGTNDYAPGATYTVGTANVVLTAQWKALVAKYTVIFKDGETTLDTKLVDVGSNPSDAGIDKTKPLFTFAAWQLSGSDIALDDASWASVAANAEVTLTARWAKAYASNADFEAYIIANKSEKDDADKAEAYVKSLNYALSTKTGTTFDANDETNNGAYAGLKIKNAGTVLSWNVVAGKVVELKAGVMVANGSLAINSGTPTTIDGGSTTSGNDNYKIHYFYSATEALYEFTTSNGSAEVIKAITMRDPFTVTFAAHGDADPASMQGIPSVTLPAATNGSASLLGWFDAATGGNKIGEAGDSYVPTANITLHAQWESISTDARLASITLDPSTGVLSPAFDPEVTEYTYTMPYGTVSVPQIVEATSVNANAQDPEIASQAAAWNETAVVRGVAQSGDKKTYNITMKIEPKDGVSIIKVATTGGSNKTVTGLYAGDGDVNLSSNTKMDNGKYIGFTLDGTTLQAGDRINVHTTEAANTGGSHIIFYDNMTDKNELYETGEIGGTGDNIFTINAAMVGATTAYVYRSNADAAHKWNGKVDFIEVLRPMNPVLTAIQFNSTDVAVTGTSVSATLPYGTNLASMTVTPTIVWNGAGTATVTGSWAWGANTFVVTDKDGDATTYTITLTEDELKYTVSFNTHGGSAVASKDVVAGGHLTADDVPADPEKEDYTFQHWSLTEDGAEVDITTVQVNAAVEFHAVWAAETGVIKLLDGEGHVNHTDFITAMTEGTVNFDNEDHNCVTFGSTASTIVNQSGANKFIIYNAKTNQTKIKFVLYNTNSSAQKIVLQKLSEGESATTDVEIEVPSKVRFETSYYAYNSDANRTMYVFTKNTNIKVLQVKVVDDGTPVKQAGEVGYSLNLNEGRIFAPTGEEVSYDGLTFETSSNYKVLSSTELQSQENISFTVVSPVTLVLESKGAKYQVLTDPVGSGDEFAPGTHEHDLTAGTWYIVSSTGSNMKFANIAFSAPKCEKPAIVDLNDVDLCENDPYSALTVSATVSDGGTLHYAWFKEAGATDEPVGTDAASFTPEADGEYYVIVTNQLDGFADNTETSNAVTVQHLAGTTITTAPVSVRKDAGEAATLSVVAAGKNLSYEWFTCNADGTGAEPLEPAATETSLEVIVPDGEQYYKVVVSGDCGTVEAIAKVEKWVELTQQDVTETTFWDFSKNGVTGNTTIPVTEEEPVKLLANIPGVNNNELFRSDNIVAGSGKLTTGYVQTQKLSFHATVPGYITVTFSNTGNKENFRYLVVNGVQTSAGSKNGTAISYSCAVPAGDVELTVTEADGGKMFNFRSLKFEKVDYYRETRPGYYGTICLPNGGKMYDAALYEVAYFDGADKIFFDEVVDGTMEPGMPYIFLPEGDARALAVAYTDEDPAEAKSKNGLYGSYTQEELTPDAGNYVLLNNQYLFVNTTNVFVGANRAYIRLGEISTTATAPAPGRRRIVLDVHSEQTATGVENVNDASEQPQKLMINGKMFILRGEKLFDATGRLVK